MLNFLILCHLIHSVPVLTSLCFSSYKQHTACIYREEWMLVTILSMRTTVENTTDLKAVLMALIFPSPSKHFYDCIFQMRV